MTTTAIGYIRVSTDKQAEQGVSLEAQRKKLEAYAALYDIELVRIIVDTESAKTLQRKGLQDALRALSGGEAQAMLVAKLDRLTRSVTDLGVLVDKFFSNAALLSVSEQVDTRSAAGRLVLNVLGSVSQWERETIGERTSQAMQHMKANGQYTGGRPLYGFNLLNGELVENTSEQAVLRLVRKYRAKGMTLRAIAEALSSKGLQSRAGKNFHPSQISRMAAA
jgi:DNA invertase Pin-like site-specific DNA recombinase